MSTLRELEGASSSSLTELIYLSTRLAISSGEYSTAYTTIKSSTTGTTGYAPSPTPALHSPTPRSAPAALVRDEQRTVEFTTPLSDDEDRVDAYHDDEPLHYRTLDNIFGD